MLLLNFRGDCCLSKGFGLTKAFCLLTFPTEFIWVLATDAEIDKKIFVVKDRINYIKGLEWFWNQDESFRKIFPDFVEDVIYGTGETEFFYLPVDISSELDTNLACIRGR